MPEELRPCWPCYRLIIEGLASPAEIENVMSLDDVQLLCMASDYWWDITHPPRGVS